MKGLMISDTSRIHRFSQRGGITRFTKCPYCGHMVDHLNGAKSNCGHIEKIWEAGGRWYVRFSQFKQGWHVEHVEPRKYPKDSGNGRLFEEMNKRQYLPKDWRGRLLQR